MGLLNDFDRVSRTQSRTCPVCQHNDWCLVSRDDKVSPSRVICARVESRKRFGEAGWLHLLRDDGKRWNGVRRRTLRLGNAVPDESLAVLAEQFRGSLDQKRLASLAWSLGISAESLQRLSIGWNGVAFSFPMLDPEGRVVGIALRRPNGSKYAVTGGRQGLFVPTGIAAGEQILVCEGQTDAAACLDLGFQAIGRPGCRSTLLLCVALTRKLEPARVVVVGDTDDQGRSGAATLASALTVRCRDVRVIFPPEGVKDLREWKRRGAAHADVAAAIEAAVTVRLGVRVLGGVRS